MAGKEYQIGFVIGGSLASSFAKSFQAAAKTVTGVNQKLATLSAQAAKTDRLIKLRAQTQALSKDFFHQKATLENLNSAIGRTANPSKEMLKAQAKAETQLARTKQKMDSQMASLRGLNRELKAAGQSTAALERRQKSLQRSAERAQRAQSHLKNIRDKQGSVSVVGASVGAGLVSTFNVGAQFEKALSGLKAASGADDAAMKRAEQAAMQYGESTKFSGAQAVEGMTALNKAGYSLDESILAVGPALHLAAAEGMSLERAAEINADVLNQFGLGAEQAGRGADFLAKTSNLSSTNVEGLYNALKYAGPAAKKYNVTLEETGAALTVLSGKGIKGEAGGTAVRAVMDGLYAPVNDARKVIKALGIAVYDAQGKALPFAKVLQNTDKAISGLTEERKNAALQKIFGTSAAGTANVLMEASRGALAQYTDALQDARGESERIAKVQEDNLIGDLTVLASKFSSVAIAIYQGVAPALRWFTQLCSSVGSTVGDFVAKYPTLAKVLTWVASAFAVVMAAMLPVGLVLSSLSVLSSIFGLAFAAINPTLLLVAGAVLALVTAGTLLYQNWDTIKEKAAELWQWISDIFTKIGDTIAGAWEKAKAFFGFGLKSTTVEVMTKHAAQVPGLASGGIVTAPTLAMVGEGRESEAILPLSKLGQLVNSGSGTNSVVVNLSVNVTGSEQSYTDVKRGIDEGTSHLKRELERLLNHERRLSFV